MPNNNNKKLCFFVRASMSFILLFHLIKKNFLTILTSMIQIYDPEPSCFFLPCNLCSSEKNGGESPFFFELFYFTHYLGTIIDFPKERNASNVIDAINFSSQILKSFLF